MRGMDVFRSKTMSEIEPLLESLFSYLLNRSPETVRKRSVSDRYKQVEDKPSCAAEAVGHQCSYHKAQDEVGRSSKAPAKRK